MLSETFRSRKAGSCAVAKLNSSRFMHRKLAGPWHAKSCSDLSGAPQYASDEHEHGVRNLRRHPSPCLSMRRASQAALRSRNTPRATGPCASLLSYALGTIEACRLCKRCSDAMQIRSKSCRTSARNRRKLRWRILTTMNMRDHISPHSRRSKCIWTSIRNSEQVSGFTHSAHSRTTMRKFMLWSSQEPITVAGR